jgi:hypothetical protein
MVPKIPQVTEGNNSKNLPLRLGHFVLLLGIALTPEIILVLANFGHVAVSATMPLFLCAEFICYLTVFALPFFLRGGGFARFTLARVQLSANTWAVLIAALPAIFFLVAAMLQLRSVSAVILEENLFKFKYHEEFYSYTPSLWFYRYGYDVMRIGAFAWIVIQALNLNLDRQRTGIIALLLIARNAIAILYGYSWVVFEPNYVSSRRLIETSWLHYLVERLVAVIIEIWLLLVLEKAFRPSLVPIVVLFVCQFLYECLFEYPVGALGIGAHLAAGIVIWLIVRRSRWGTEKWTDYQQRQESLQSE